jgi:lipopolysaccharide transport system ATP-binding protein
LIDSQGRAISFVNIDQLFGIEVRMVVDEENPKIVPNFHFYTQGQCAFVSSPAGTAITSSGIHLVTMWIPANFLNDGFYEVKLAATTMVPQTVHFHEQTGFCFNVIDDIHSDERSEYANAIPGAVRPRLRWDMAKTGTI